MSDFSGERAPFLGAPPTRVPVQAIKASAVRGRRVVLSRPDGFVYDVRAVSEVFTDALGEPRVDVCSEQAYYRWMLTNVTPAIETYHAACVWVE